jgi:hypothetical protein
MIVLKKDLVATDFTENALCSLHALILPLPHSYPQLRTSKTLFIGSGSVPVE